MLITISSFTSFPDSTICFISAFKVGLNVEAAYPFNILRISSPVDTWFNFKSFLKNLAYVPFPTPGAPNKNKNF
jgi:hypothetical protein